MKATRTLFVLTVSTACLLATGTINVNAINPEPSAHGSAQSGDLMLTVSAVKHQDGSVDGHASFRNRTANTKVDIDIDCLIVGVGIGGGMVGGDESVDAILSGIISRSTSPDLAVGDQVAFTLRDNGEGQTSQPDQFTPPGRAKGPCAVGMIGGFLNNERGNIVIKPDEPAN